RRQRARDQEGETYPRHRRAHQTVLQLFQFALTLRHPNFMSVAGRVPGSRGSRALRSRFPVTRPKQAGLYVTLVAGLGVAGVVVSAPGCAHVEATPCAADKDCKMNRLCDAGRCVWPGDATRPSVTAPGLGGPSVPLPQYAVEPAQSMFRFGPTH